MAKRSNGIHVSGIVGSPRRGGNTEILVDEVLAGAAEEGAHTEKIILSELDIGPCQACDACFKRGDCIQQDDMQALYRKLDRSDVWVLGTPVYYCGPTAQFKAFLDRWYGGDHGRIVNFKGKRAILTITLESKEETSARHTLGMLTDALDWLTVEVSATIIAPGVKEKGAVHRHPDILVAARRAGKEAVRSPRDGG